MIEYTAVEPTNTFSILTGSVGLCQAGGVTAKFVFTDIPYENAEVNLELAGLFLRSRTPQIAVHTRTHPAKCSNSREISIPDQLTIVHPEIGNETRAHTSSLS